MNRNTALLLAVFALGCAAGMHLDSRAQAQNLPTPARAQQWQQQCVSIPGTVNGPDWFVNINKKLVGLGAQGWELVTIDPGAAQFACFKRLAE
jgi:hypothetical protein